MYLSFHETGDYCKSHVVYGIANTRATKHQADVSEVTCNALATT